MIDSIFNKKLCPNVGPTFLNRSQFLVGLHFLIEHWYLWRADICSEWDFRWLNGNGGTLLSSSLVRLSFTIHLIVTIISGAILTLGWTWFTIRLWVFYIEIKRDERYATQSIFYCINCLLWPFSRRCRNLLDLLVAVSCGKLNKFGSGAEPTTPSKPYTSFTCAYSARSSESSSGAARGAWSNNERLFKTPKFLLSPSCILLSLLTFMRAIASLTMAKFFRFSLPGC